MLPCLQTLGEQPGGLAQTQSLAKIRASKTSFRSLSRTVVGSASGIASSLKSVPTRDGSDGEVGELTVGEATDMMLVCGYKMR